ALFFSLRSGKLIQLFGKFTAALREENTGGLKLICGLRHAVDRGLKRVLFGKLRSTAIAFCKVRFDLLALSCRQLIASIKNQKRSNTLAARELYFFPHGRPANSLRSFRVARNSEFFTVSSVVPSASPIARNFNP